MCFLETGWWLPPVWLLIDSRVEYIRWLTTEIPFRVTSQLKLRTFAIQIENNGLKGVRLSTAAVEPMGGSSTPIEA
jgi:hypothetical protein